MLFEHDTKFLVSFLLIVWKKNKTTPLGVKCTKNWAMIMDTLKLGGADKFNKNKGLISWHTGHTHRRRTIKTKNRFTWILHHCTRTCKNHSLLPLRLLLLGHIFGVIR